MANQKKPYSKPQVAESPTADVFEGRHPSDGEKQWAEKMLAPTLEKAPEKPIGAPTGTNLDEQGHTRFSTISNVPVRRLYTPADLPGDWSEEKYLGFPAKRPTRAAFTPPATAESYGQCACSPALPRRKKPTGAISICLSMAAEGYRSRSICRRSWVTTPIIRPARAKLGSAVWPSIRSKTWRSCSTASTWRKRQYR